MGDTRTSSPAAVCPDDHPTIMPLRAARLLTPLAIVLALSSCRGDGNPFEPLQGGLSLSVTLTTTEGGSAGSPEQLDIAPAAGGAELSWTVTSSPCLMADASALQAGNVIEVRIHRSGNPLALCAAVMVSYHYVANVQIPAPGRYEVRLFARTALRRSARAAAASGGAAHRDGDAVLLSR